MKRIINSIFVLMLLLVSACGGGFSGEYRALQGAVVMDFRENGRVTQSMVGNSLAEFDFDRNGDEIKVFVAPGIAQIYEIQSKDVIIGPAGVTLVKRR